MKKILFLGLLLAGLLIVYGCIPPTSEEGVADDVALAGQAIALGCQTTKVVSCTESENTITGTQRGASRTNTFRLIDGCTGRNANVAQNYSCVSSTQRRVCRTQCTAEEVCTNGACVTSPINITTNVTNQTGVGNYTNRTLINQTFQINSTTNATNQTGIGNFTNLTANLTNRTGIGNFTNQTLINQTAGNSTNKTNSTG